MELIKASLIMTLAIVLLLGFAFWQARVWGPMTDHLPEKQVEELRNIETQNALNQRFERQTQDTARKVKLSDDLADAKEQILAMNGKKEERRELSDLLHNTNTPTQMSLPPTAPGGMLPTPAVTPLEQQQADGTWKAMSDVDVDNTDDITGTWRVTVPASAVVTKPLHFRAGQLLQQISLTGEIKLNAQDNWTTPPQGRVVAERLPTGDLFINPKFYAGEAIAKFGGDDRPWLSLRNALVTVAFSKPENLIKFSINCHTGETGSASGSYTFTFRITTNP